MDLELARLNELMRESTVAMNNLLHADMSWQYSPQQKLSNSKDDELARLEALVREATHNMDSPRQQSTHWDTEVLMQETNKGLTRGFNQSSIFSDELLLTSENVTASPEATQQNDQAGPQDVDPLNTVPVTEEQEPRPQPQVPTESQPRESSEPIESEQGPEAPQEPSVEVPSQSEMPEQIFLRKGGRCKKARAGRVGMSPPAKATKGPSNTPDAHESNSEANPVPLRKRTRRTAASSAPPPS
ncbi:hypothetical protein V6N12_036826 [Hibiscus sabdariffa]|uniref:Uncharacterized protein n=1 Tax=Hibiscus sabdariffa TaxID=183260 RepID=A0ABR2BV09_9ROSI